MEVGKYTYGKENIKIYSWGENTKIRIGKYCSIATNCHIYKGGNHRIDWITTYPFGHIHKETFKKYNGFGHPMTKGDVVIGNDVWIAANVTIMSGVTIGDGAVIANNSHVVKNVEPYSLVGGNPAKHIKYRFEKEQIDELLKIKWWEWPESKVDDASPLLCSGNINEFIEKYKVQ